MKLIFLGIFTALVLSQCPEASAQQDLGTVTVHGKPDYSGIWTPDVEANARLEREMRKALRKKMKQAGGKKSRPPAFGPEGGGPLQGGSPGGQSGGPPAGASGDGPPGPRMAEPNAHGAMRQEMDFAAPLQGDLEIASSESEFRIGRSGTPLTRLEIGRGATELADGHTRVFATWESTHFVVEFNTDDGAQVTHTYSLEDQGNRLRIHTNVSGRMSPISGGIDMERLFVRKP